MIQKMMNKFLFLLVFLPGVSWGASVVGNGTINIGTITVNGGGGISSISTTTTGADGFIWNGSAYQTGSQFYVSSGVVNNYLSIGTSTFSYPLYVLGNTSATAVSATLQNIDTSTASHTILNLIANGSSTGGNQFINFISSTGAAYSLGHSVYPPSASGFNLASGNNSNIVTNLIFSMFSNVGYFYVPLDISLGAGEVSPTSLYVHSLVSVAAPLGITVRNDNSSAVSNAMLTLRTGAPTAGDSFVYYQTIGGSPWVSGVDNSDNDKYKISQSTYLGVNDYLSINSTGSVFLTGELHGTDVYFGTSAKIISDGTDGILDIYNNTLDSYLRFYNGGVYNYTIDPQGTIINNINTSSSLTTQINLQAGAIYFNGGDPGTSKQAFCYGGDPGSGAKTSEQFGSFFMSTDDSGNRWIPCIRNGYDSIVSIVDNIEWAADNNRLLTVGIGTGTASGSGIIDKFVITSGTTIVSNLLSYSSATGNQMNVNTVYSTYSYTVDAVRAKQFMSTGGTVSSPAFQSDSADDGMNVVNDLITFTISGNEISRINSNGLLVNTTTYTRNLTINGNSDLGADAQAGTFTSTNTVSTSTLNGYLVVNKNLKVTEKVGIGTGSPTHSLTFVSTATGIAFYNTTDQTTNYDRTTLSYTSNEFQINQQSGGSGTTRPYRFSAGIAAYYVSPTGGGFNNFHTWNITNTATNPTAGMFGALSSLAQTSGTTKNFRIAPTINQSSTAGYTALVVDVTQTATGSGTKLLTDMTVDTTSMFKVDTTGKVFISSTVTAGGTTGNQTINKPSGTVNFAIGASAITVTNSVCTASSLVFATVRTNDTTALIKNVVPAAGSFVITLNANATAETSVGFVVFN